MSKVDPQQVKRVKQLLKTAPSSWKQMFKSKGTSNTASLNEIISTVLSYTPSMRSSGRQGKAKYAPPKKVRDEALLGLELSHRENYTSASGIGLVRAIQLVVEPKIWERSVLRMSKYFGRHGRDKNSANFGNDANPSRGYMAWLNWGGDSGKVWADKLVNKDELSRSSIKNPTTLVDVLLARGNRMVSNSPIVFSLGDGNALIEEGNGYWSLLTFSSPTESQIVKTEPEEHYLEILLQTNPIKVAKKVIRDSKGRKIPQKYLKGYKGDDLEERIEEIEGRRDEYQAALDKYGDEDDFPKSTIKKLYRPFKSDQGIKSKRSPYTVEAKRRGFTGSIANKAKQASKYYGAKIPPSILKDVNKRGMAAWASGGHRPGQTSHSWGIARVNSFLVGGKAFFTSDSDLAKKLPKKVQTAIKKKRVWKG